MRVFTHEKRSGNALGNSIVTNRLGNGQDVSLSERGILGSAAMSARAETDKLPRIAGVQFALTSRSTSMRRSAGAGLPANGESDMISLLITPRGIGNPGTPPCPFFGLLPPLARVLEPAKNDRQLPAG